MINLNQTVKAKLKEGMYTVKLLSFEQIENPQGGYLKTILKFPDRDVTNNIFPSSFDYFISCLQRQLGKTEEELKAIDLLNLAKETDINIWLEYNDYGMNIAFHDKNYNSTKDVNPEDVSI